MIPKITIQKSQIPEHLLDFFKPKAKYCNLCYLCHSLAVLDELWRVLRDDGICFLNLGDSYYSGGRAYGTSGKAPEGYQDGGSSLSNPDGEYQDASSRRKSRKGTQPAPESSAYEGAPIQDHSPSHYPSPDSAGSVRQQPSGLLDPAMLGQQPSLDLGDGQPLASQVSTPDSFSGGSQGYPSDPPYSDSQLFHRSASKAPPYIPEQYSRLKPKSLVLIPQRLALAAQQNGWCVRSDVIWCLSGGTYIYARTAGSEGPMMIKDIARLAPGTVRLWNGQKWTRMLGASKTVRNGTELEIVLRSGERIRATPTHRFPTLRGTVESGNLKIGDRLQRVCIEDGGTQPQHITEDAAWLTGLYIAEGSRSGQVIQIAGHVKEEQRWERLQRIATAYGGYATRTIDGNSMSVRLYGKVLVGLMEHLVSGHTSHNKGLSAVCWTYGNTFLQNVLQGYLEGDGSYEIAQKRWRLGFTRNYNLERDLRTICARLGYHLVLNLVTIKGFGKRWPAFRGELRMERSGHHNQKDAAEILKIRKAHSRQMYDIGVEDEPHVFSLASGIVTHNSKPNTMPDSVQDRPTNAYEHILILVKNPSRPLFWFHREGRGSRRQPPADFRWQKRKALDLDPQWHGAAPGLYRPDLYEGVSDLPRSWEVEEERQEAPTGWTKKDHEWVRVNLWEGRPYFWDQWAVKEPQTGTAHPRRKDGLRDGTGTKTDSAVRGTHRGLTDLYVQVPGGRNLRDVWTIPVKGFKGAHFATFPLELAERCIKASTSEHGACGECGAPYARVLGEPGRAEGREPGNRERRLAGQGDDGRLNDHRGSSVPYAPLVRETLRWVPTCEHQGAPVVPCTVLDPFAGSGTTLAAAKSLGRRGWGVEVSEAYCEISRRRLEKQETRLF